MLMNSILIYQLKCNIEGYCRKEKKSNILGKKRIEYVTYEARANLTNHAESKEYKQVKLLRACVDSIREIIRVVT